MYARGIPDLKNRATNDAHKPNLIVGLIQNAPE
jgi:hypothetical protein